MYVINSFKTAAGGIYIYYSAPIFFLFCPVLFEEKSHKAVEKRVSLMA